ncbi:hypothetical protein MYX75_03895 [Acidobacteria bacterium AH-259-A15]|nr:hypothetical protein [Acidobacteria bacterium AH-259-A15]
MKGTKLLTIPREAQTSNARSGEPAQTAGVLDHSSDCPICGTKEGCSCRKALSRYFELLLRVEKRSVSSWKPESATVGPNGTACIDKVSLSLALWREELMARAKYAGLQLKAVRLRDGRWYTQVGDEAWGWYLYPGYFGAEWITKIITRPSAFSSFQDYLQMLRRLFSDDELATARIIRLDFAVDYPLPLRQILRCLDVSCKRIKIEYQEEGAEMTGILVGRGLEKVLVYDKGRKTGDAKPLTRIEIQLSGKKLPAWNLLALPELVERRIRPFKAVKLHEIKLCDPSSLLSDKARMRHHELQVLIDQQGYLAARKKLNRTGNFQRDYGSFINLTSWAETPDDTLARDLLLFFRSDDIQAQDAVDSELQLDDYVSAENS